MNARLDKTSNVIPFSATGRLRDLPAYAPIVSYRAADMRYQNTILPGVSRTFALTIPQLPRELVTVVTNAYLLCRIADTIEDEVALSREQKHTLSKLFAGVVAGKVDPEVFARRCFPLLSDKTLAAERDLVRNTARIIRIMHGFNSRQRAAIERCVCVMCDGMAHFQSNVTTAGLDDMAELNAYCYCVAGVVGEMLTELFCDYLPELDCYRGEMMRLAVSFGQGLQMTNILKDIWDDRERGACWLPRDLFEDKGLDLDTHVPGSNNPAFNEALTTLVGITHHHLRNALRYTLLIPAKEAGVRKFCLWAIGLAVLTLRKINHHRNFTGYREVKIKRRTVHLTVLITNVSISSNAVLRGLFRLGAQGLPLQVP
ncbi:MAG: phytoene/squalene synthase family protein [Pseudomonadota bacterium]